MRIDKNEKIALITGITGQDGSYLAELLLEKGYIIYGTFRRSSMKNTKRIDPIISQIRMRYIDLTDFSSITGILSEIIKKHQFEYLEVYNLAAQSHVKISFDLPIFTSNVDAIGCLNVLEAVRQMGLSQKCKIYQASTSEQFGEVLTIPQNELTPFNPRSPYAVAKVYAHQMCDIYRSSYNMFINNFVLFNHESPRRAENFVTRKITLGISDILNEKRSYIELGNLDSLRDWGHAKDYVYAMWLGMQMEKSGYYVISTGHQYSVRQFVEEAFKCANIVINWKGEGTNEVGFCKETNKEYIKVNEYYYRPLEVETLLGDSSKFTNLTGWKPQVDFKSLVKEMVESDVKNPLQYSL